MDEDLPNSLLETKENTGKKDFFLLMFPGAPASGKGMWAGAGAALEQLGAENFRYEESITTPAAFAGVRSEQERYTRIADSVAEKVQDRNKLVVTGHSFGGAEALLFLQTIASDKRFEGKQVELVMLSPILIGKEGVSSFWKLFEGSKDILANRDIFEADYACPLPVEVSRLMPTILDKDVGLGDLDIGEDAVAYRHGKFAQVVKEKLGGAAAQELLVKIFTLDTQLTNQVTRVEVVNPDLLAERRALIAPFVQNLMDADYLATDIKAKVRELYNPDESENWVSFLGLAAGYVGRLIKDAYQGHAQVLRKITATAVNHGIKINSHLVYFDNDRFFKPDQVESAQRALADVANLWLMPEKDHFTVSYDAKTFMDIIAKVTDEAL